jgi:hypothetical protein
MPIEPSRVGRPPQPTCKRGHPESCRRRDKRGWPYCPPCRRLIQKRRDRFAGHVGRMERLLREGLMFDTKEPAVRFWQRRVFGFFDDVEGKRMSDEAGART